MKNCKSCGTELTVQTASPSVIEYGGFCTTCSSRDDRYIKELWRRVTGKGETTDITDDPDTNEEHPESTEDQDFLYLSDKGNR
jgi:hypothetical protein